jgi:hypothetical protein
MERGDQMREVLRWMVVVAAILVIVGLISYARGPKHHRGDEIGSHGTHLVP